MTSFEPSRRYHEWTAQDYRIVVTAILTGMSDADVARGVARTLSAVKTRAKYLVAEDHRDGRPAWQRLREELAADRDYDWESIARRAHAAEGLPYWDEAAEQRLKQVWDRSAASGARSWLRRGHRRAPALMGELEAELGIDEFEIAKRLRYLGWAASITEVVDRLGAAHDGLLAVRARLVADRLSVTVHVLVVTDESGAVLHTSVHPDQSAAEQVRDGLGVQAHPLATWTIAARALGDGEIGKQDDLTGSFGTAGGDTPGSSFPELSDPPRPPEPPHHVSGEESDDA